MCSLTVEGSQHRLPPINIERMAFRAHFDFTTLCKKDVFLSPSCNHLILALSCIKLASIVNALLIDCWAEISFSCFFSVNPTIGDIQLNFFKSTQCIWCISKNITKHIPIPNFRNRFKGFQFSDNNTQLTSIRRNWIPGGGNNFLKIIMQSPHLFKTERSRTSLKGILTRNYQRVMIRISFG